MTARVFVVVQGRWGSSDISGCLMLETGEVLWNHISSSMSWLRRDLTDGFSDRRQQLEQRFPDGYKVVVIDVDNEFPAELRAANEAFYPERFVDADEVDAS